MQRKKVGFFTSTSRNTFHLKTSQGTLDPIFHISNNNNNQCQAQHWSLWTPLVTGWGATSHHILSAGCWLVPHPLLGPFVQILTHQLLREETVGNWIKSLGTIQSVDVCCSAHINKSGCRKWSSWQAMFALSESMLVFPIMCFIWPERASRAIHSLISPGTEITLMSQ